MTPTPPPSSSQPVAIDPSHIPMLLSQHRAQLAAFEHVLSLKTKILEHLDQMETHVAEGHLSKALALYIEIQRIEYSLQVQGFQDKVSQLTDSISQLERMASTRVVVPGFRPPPIPGTNRQRQ